ncbi:glycosyltransferase [Ancylobacter tetraedralis]|nr:glycosyltransferase family 4 protein [Ancylobacter tetraedralis]
MMAWLERRGFDVVLVYCPLPGEGPDEARLRELMDYCLALAQLDGVPGRVDGAIEPTGRWAETLRTFCPDALVKVAQALDRAVEPAMVIANYIWTSRSLRHLRPGVLKAIQTHDVFSSLGGKVIEFGISHGLAMAPQEEALMLEPADLVLAVQPEEAAELRRIVSGPTVLHVGIDMNVVSEARTPERPTVLLIGSGNAMNVKGLRDFLRFSWPRIRDAIPEAELQVAGSLGRAVPFGTEGVRALGFIDDLTPVYAGARLVINPAVAGTGIKIKTLEAMAHLRPLVTWPSGVDGVAPELRAVRCRHRLARLHRGRRRRCWSCTAARYSPPSPCSTPWPGTSSPPAPDSSTPCGTRCPGWWTGWRSTRITRASASPRASGCWEPRTL